MEWLSKVATDVVSELFGTTDDITRKDLQRSGVLTETQLINFFRAATTAMESADVKSQLRLAAADGQDACDVVTEVQRGVFESQGVDGDFGIEFLAHVREVYGNDLKIMADFFRFVAREELALDEAELTPEEFERKQMWLRHAQEEYRTAVKGDSLLLTSNWDAYLQRGPISFN
eukprot:jgi/Botrbrau1/9881/Bobra.0080s0016.1